MLPLGQASSIDIPIITATACYCAAHGTHIAEYDGGNAHNRLCSRELSFDKVNSGHRQQKKLMAGRCQRISNTKGELESPEPSVTLRQFNAACIRGYPEKKKHPANAETSDRQYGFELETGVDWIRASRVSPREGKLSEETTPLLLVLVFL
jgi:hypothetical protein